MLRDLVYHFFKRQKRRIAALLALCMCLSPIKLNAAATPPSPGDNILIIYVDDSPGGWNIGIKNNVVSALTAMAPAGIVPTITLLPVLTTDTNGVWAAMQRHVPAINDFSAYCQVWDIRFYLGPGPTFPASTPCSPPNASDTITLTGANNDASLYTTFLNQGGHLLLMGDNYGFCARNQNLVQYVNSVISGGMGTPWYTFPAAATFNIVDNTAPDFFQTNYANLAGGIGTAYPGQIIIGGAANQSGGGKPLVSMVSGADTFALALEWSAGQLVGGTGQLVTIWDSNTIQTQLTGWQGYVQNLYTTLSTCYKVQLNKSVASSNITVCDQATYTICYNNVGTRAVPAAQVWDTISTCLSFSSASIAPSVSGQLYTWNLGTVNGGATACVTVVLDVLQVPPCP